MRSPDSQRECPLSLPKRTQCGRGAIAAFDPEATLAGAWRRSVGHFFHEVMRLYERRAGELSFSSQQGDAMVGSIMYHEGNRRLQDQFESRRIADRLEEKQTRAAFTEKDKDFIESAVYFFIATADAEGRPDCSFKGGMPGFVRVSGPSELAFPDYDGNGMFKSLGNIIVNPHVGLLFIGLHDKPRRLRINGVATVSRDDPLLPHTVGAQMIVRVQARAIFPNCPRYIPTMQLIEPSTYVPRPNGDPPEPAWKSFDDFKDYVHPRQPTARTDPESK